jgi:hypothetical protein
VVFEVRVHDEGSHDLRVILQLHFDLFEHVPQAHHLRLLVYEGAPR